MAIVSQIFNWKVTLVVTLLILLALNVLSFYGFYTNTFYFLKPDNYIFPVLSMVHFLYIYVFWSKITENGLPSPKMRNIEYALYPIMIVYFFKVYDSLQILGSVSQLGEQVVPATFKPMATITLILYSMLFLVTPYTFRLRKKYIGNYNFEHYNDNLNIWQ